MLKTISRFRSALIRYTIATILAIAVTSVSVVIDTKNEIATDDQKMRAIVDSLADSIDRQLLAWRLALTAMSVAHELDYPYDLEAYSKEAKKFAVLSGTNIAYYKAADDGLTLLFHTKVNDDALPKYYSKENIQIFFNSMQNVRETGQTAVSNFFLGPIAGEYIASMIVPRAGQINPTEMLSLNFSSRDISALLRRITLPKDYIVGVVDSNGMIGARSINEENFVGKFIPAWYKKVLEQSESGFARGPSVHGAPFEEYRYIFKHLSEAKGWQVSLLVPPTAYPIVSVGPLSLIVGFVSLSLLNAIAWLFGSAQRQKVEVERQYQNLTHRLLDELPGAVLRARLASDGKVDVQLAFGKLSDELVAVGQVKFDKIVARHLSDRKQAGETSGALEFDIKEEGKIFRFFVIEAGPRQFGVQEFNIYILDITNQRSAEATAISSTRLAALGQMAATLAHEMSQPINVISLAADNAESLIRDRDLDGIAAKIQKIRDFSGKSRYLIDNLLSFARGDRDDDPPVSVDLQRAIWLAHELTHSLLLREKVKLIFSSSDEPIYVLGRPIELENIFVNLIVNSVDAYRHHVTAAERHIQISVSTTDTHVIVTVEDHAGGISDEVLPRLFEPFVTTKSQGHGTGLGLAFVSGHIRTWGGAISVRNSKSGAIFEIRLSRGEQSGRA